MKKVYTIFYCCFVFLYTRKGIMFGRFFKVRFMRMRINMLTIFMGAVYMCLFYILLHAWLLHKDRALTMRRMGLNLSKVAVHIDLKGSPPKLGYLTSLLPLFKDLGANTLLLEYEDMFPYKGHIANLSSRYCYKEHELKKFIKIASNTGFEIIPLIQTFGHLEHALKLAEFKHLRELPIYPDSICPSNTESIALINSMLRQIIYFHNSVVKLKHIHIGCDEVFHLNKCAQCRSRGQTDIDIYMNHLQQVKETVRVWSPNTTILFWDDMLRGVNSDDWNKFNNFSSTEPVYWDYSSFLRVSHRNLYNYHKKFENIWIASAFKGAEGRTATLPNMLNRFMNHIEWVKLILHYKFGGEKKIFSFKGIILTGWSRYSHMDPLCELLPVSIPSLVLNLLLIKAFQVGYFHDIYSLKAADIFDKYLKHDFLKYLQCDDDINLESFNGYSCKFKESKMYNALEHYIFQNDDLLTKINDVKEGIHSIEYYYKVDNLNMNIIAPTITWCNETLVDLYVTQNRISNTMLNYYDDYVIKEYIHYKFNDNIKKLEDLLVLLQNYYTIHTWQTKT